MNCRLQDEVQSMCEGAEAWCAGNRKFWAAAVGQKQPFNASTKLGATQTMIRMVLWKRRKSKAASKTRPRQFGAAFMPQPGSSGCQPSTVRRSSVSAQSRSIRSR